MLKFWKNDEILGEKFKMFRILNFFWRDLKFIFGDLKFLKFGHCVCVCKFGINSCYNYQFYNLDALTCANNFQNLGDIKVYGNYLIQC